MSSIVRLVTDDGPLFVESEDITVKRTAGPVRDTIAQEQGAGRVLEFAASITNAVTVAFSQVRKGLSALSPSEIEVELGLKFSGEAGGAWVLAKTSGEANIKISVKWINQSA